MMEKTHELDSNTTKPATRPRPGHKLNTTDSETEICKGYGTEGSRTGKNMALDYGTNAKHSKLGDKCELDGIP